MFPYLRIGPLLVQMPLLALLVGVWSGMLLVEREAKKLELNSSSVSNLLIYSLVAGLIGARLGYALRFRALYASKPLSLFALTPSTLLPSMGFFVAMVTFWVFIDHLR